MGGYIEVAKELVSKIIDSKVRMNYEIARMDGCSKLCPWTFKRIHMRDLKISEFWFLLTIVQ